MNQDQVYNITSSNQSKNTNPSSQLNMIKTKRTKLWICIMISEWIEFVNEKKGYVQ